MQIKIQEYSDQYFSQVSTLFDEFQGFISWIDPMKGNVWREGFGKLATKETVEEVRKNEGTFLLAFDEEKVIGFITGIIKHPSEVEQYTLAKLRNEGRITELYLTGGYQGKGVGKKLMAAVEDFFKSKQVEVIRVEVFAPNEHARKFYEKMGFLERSLDLVKEF